MITWIFISLQPPIWILPNCALHKPDEQVEIQTVQPFNRVDDLVTKSCVCTYLVCTGRRGHWWASWNWGARGREGKSRGSGTSWHCGQGRNTCEWFTHFYTQHLSVVYTLIHKTPVSGLCTLHIWVVCTRLHITHVSGLHTFTQNTCEWFTQFYTEQIWMVYTLFTQNTQLVYPLFT